VAGEFRRPPVDGGDHGDHGLGLRVSVIVERNSMVAVMRQYGTTNAAFATIS
jgi:hypothetical protein